MLNLLILIASVAAILFGLLAFFLLRRSKRLVLGTVFAVVSLFFVLTDIKLFQFHKMGSTPMSMPATTVTSAVVKEEDWAPTLTSVGSISAVQAAMVARELARVVSQVAFENGGVAKKGDLLVQLDASAEEAQLHRSEERRVGKKCRSRWSPYH